MNDLYSLFCKNEIVSKNDIVQLKLSMSFSELEKKHYLYQDTIDQSKGYHINCPEFKNYCLDMLVNDFAAAMTGFRHILAATPNDNVANRAIILDAIRKAYGAMEPAEIKFNYVPLATDERSKWALYRFYIELAMTGRIPSSQGFNPFKVVALRSAKQIEDVFNNFRIPLDNIDKLFISEILKMCNKNVSNLFKKILKELDKNEEDSKQALQSLKQELERFDSISIFSSPKMTLILKVLDFYLKTTKKEILSHKNDRNSYSSYSEAISDDNYAVALEMIKSLVRLDTEDLIIKRLLENIVYTKDMPTNFGEKQPNNMSHKDNPSVKENGKPQSKKLYQPDSFIYSLKIRRNVITNAEDFKLLIRCVFASNLICFASFSEQVYHALTCNFMNVRKLQHVKIFHTNNLCSQATCILIKSARKKWPDKKIQQLKEKGNVAFDSEDYTTAIKMYTEYLGRLSDIDYEVLLLLADAYSALGKYEEAVACAGFVYYSEQEDTYLLADAEEVYCEVCYEAAKNYVTAYLHSYPVDSLLNTDAIKNKFSDIYLMEVYIAFIEYLVKNELHFYARFLYDELIMLKPFPKEGPLYNQIQSISDMLGYSTKINEIYL